LQNLLPENPQLLLRQPIADTAMNAGSVFHRKCILR
jgi:hypothetical protein